MGTGTSLNTKRSTATWNHIKHVENIRKWCDVTHCHTCMHVRVCIHTCIHVCVYMYLHTYVYVVVHVWNMKHDTSKARQHDNFILHMYMTTSSSLGTWEDVMGWEVIQTWEDVSGMRSETDMHETCGHISTHTQTVQKINLNKTSSGTLRSTWNQSSKPCTVLQYPSRDAWNTLGHPH